MGLFAPLAALGRSGCADDSSVPLNRAVSCRLVDDDVLVFCLSARLIASATKCIFFRPCRTDNHLQFLCAHCRLYSNAPGSCHTRSPAADGRGVAATTCVAACGCALSRNVVARPETVSARRPEKTLRSDSPVSVRRRWDSTAGIISSTMQSKARAQTI